MKELNPNITITDLKVLSKEKYLGQNMLKAPQPALTVADGTALTSSGGAASHVDASAINVIDNMRTRINELEIVLKNLNLIK